jgi:UDP:flavonoid glycosyltransferase YjiC (YdhE family)
MKVLFVPWALSGHYFPMVPLVWAFRSAGHEVRVATQPGAAEVVRKSGMTVAEVGGGYDFIADMQEMFASSRSQLPMARAIISPDLRTSLRNGAAKPVPAQPTAEQSTAQQQARAHKQAAAATQSAQELRQMLYSKIAPFARAGVAMADDLVALAEAWHPDLVIADPFVMAAPLAASRAGAPLVHSLWGPALQRQIGIFPVSGLPGHLWPAELIRVYEKHGVQPQPEFAAATVDPCPDRLQFPVVPNRIPVRYIPYNGSGDWPDWVLAPPARPRVCVTWGTLTTLLVGEDSFKVPGIVTALADVGVEVVVTLTAADRDRLGTPPEGVRVVTGLPLHLLLPSCQAIVHQGGGGTMLTAASFGVPQVIVSGAMDQLTCGVKLEAAGAGRSLGWGDVGTSDFTDAVEAVLSDDTVRKSATALREEMAAQPSPAAVADELAQRM